MKTSLSRPLSFRQAAIVAALLMAWCGTTQLQAQVAVTPSSQPNAPLDAATSSTEQGQTPLTDTFEFREFQLAARRKALEDTKFEFNLRLMYMDRNQFDGSYSQAFAFGGWAGLKTGYFLDHFAFGLTGYAAVPIYAPDDRGGTGMLKVGDNGEQEGYAVLGEIYTEIRIIDDMTLSIGRKAFDTPFINRTDTRMTPNTFEAAVLQGRITLGSPPPPLPAPDPKDAKATPEPTPAVALPFIKYGLGYFSRIKERNSDEFVPMSEDAGSSVDRGVWAAGLIYEKGKFSIGAIDYYSDDVINIAYAETKGEVPLGSLKPRLAAQFVDQRSAGSNPTLEGDDFEAHQFGIKAELPVSHALFTVAFTAASGDTNLRAPWSGYPGYTSVQVQDFNRRGENAVLFRIGYDFPCLEGLSAYALAVIGTDPDGDTQYRQDEYDLNVQWVPPKGVLKGLSIRARYAVVQQHGGNVEDLTDLRGIVNYNIKF
jgi:outer membrane porin, OprD family